MMLPLTGDELKMLIGARDLLERLGNGPEAANDLARLAYLAVLATMHRSYLDIRAVEVNLP